MNKKIIISLLVLLLSIGLILFVMMPSSIIEKEQKKVEEVKEMITKDLSAEFNLVEVSVSDTNDKIINGGEDIITIKLEHVKDSMPIKINDMFIGLYAKVNSKQKITYGNLSESQFQTRFIKKDSNYPDWAFNSDDIIEINFILTSDFNISEGEYLRITLYPKGFAPVNIELETPTIMNEKITYLYPGY